MREYLKFYIDGRWVEPAQSATFDVVNPATERVSGQVALGSASDVERAVAAARRAFASWSQTSKQERIATLRRIAERYRERQTELAAAVTEEIGAPSALANSAHVSLGFGHLTTAIAKLESLSCEEQVGATLIVKEPIGVCGLITPWNWPLNQIALKVFPALAVGCTVVLKPSENSPYSAQVLTEILDAAAVPAGVFNLVQGTGQSVGVPLSSHPGVDMISFTGSNRAGAEIAKNAASTFKRVAQELGGKGPNIIMDDEKFALHVTRGVVSMMINSGQTCSAPSRMLVPRARMEEATQLARDATSKLTIGDPRGDYTIGPVVSKTQFERVQAYIARGIEEGATLVAGGPGRPKGLEKGYFVQPTVFADVTNDMVIAREEIFGPVLSIFGYDTVEHAISIANDTEYGLTSYVKAADLQLARDVARKIRSGQVVINDAFDFNAPFGGYKQSGNGREWGEYGLHEYLETKAILGFVV